MEPQIAPEDEQEVQPRLMTRQQAKRFVDHRNRMRVRTGFGILESQNQIWILILWVFVLCIGLYQIAGKKKIGEVYVDEWDEAQLEWEKNCARILIALGIGFIVITSLSYCIRHNEQKYQACLFIFFCFLMVLSINLFKAIMVGIKLEYGHVFDRKLTISNSTGPANASNNNNTKEVFDDGYYIIEDGHILGREDKETGEINKNIKGTAEPIDVYIGRFFYMSMTLLAFIFVVMMIILMLMYWCLVFNVQSRSGRKTDVDAIMNQGRLMNLMRNIPYSKFMLDGERDCPICLMQFTDESQVVQLKCNEYHIFHYTCLERYLSFPDHNAVIKQCPLCREPIEIAETCQEQVMVVPMAQQNEQGTLIRYITR